MVSTWLPHCRHFPHMLTAFSRHQRAFSDNSRFTRFRYFLQFCSTIIANFITIGCHGAFIVIGYLHVVGGGVQLIPKKMNLGDGVKLTSDIWSVYQRVLIHKYQIMVDPPSSSAVVPVTNLVKSGDAP